MILAALPWVGVKTKTRLGLSPMMHQTVRDVAGVFAQTNVDIFVCANHDLTTEKDFVPAGGGRGR